jgi:hypothetical protein
VLTHPYGQGRVVYLPGRWAADYSCRATPGVVALIRSAVEWVSRSAVPVRVEGEGLVGVTLFDQPGRRLAHLVNYNADWTASYDHLEPLRGLRIALEIPPRRRPTRVHTLVSGQTLPHTFQQAAQTDRLRTVQVTLPQVEEYEVVVVEHEEGD